jgi:hypothetical protein
VQTRSNQWRAIRGFWGQSQRIQGHFKRKANGIGEARQQNRGSDPRCVGDFVGIQAPKDIVQGGIAVKVQDREIGVHPYVLRKVCVNGAIMPQIVETRRIQRVDLAASTEALEAVDNQLRNAIHLCMAPEVFDRAVHQFRSAINRQADFEMILSLMRLSSRRLSITHSRRQKLSERIQQIFSHEEEPSQFGLINAVTSVARKQSDPEIRWQLEELGGSMLASVPIKPDPSGLSATLLEEQVAS